MLQLLCSKNTRKFGGCVLCSEFPNTDVFIPHLFNGKYLNLNDMCNNRSCLASELSKTGKEV